MNLRKPTTIKFIALALTVPLILMFFADAECAQAGQKSSVELLLEIIDLHSELVANDTFLAQAKMLGAYLEAAQPLDESKKIKIYSKVLNILSKIKALPIEIQAIAAEAESAAQQKPLEEEKQQAKSVYEPGVALLEIFKIDPDRKEIPELPVIRTYWKRDLASLERVCVLPDRVLEIGERSLYASKFSFYYEAKQSGKYAFTVLDKRKRTFLRGPTFGAQLLIGGTEIIKAVNQPVSQGLCNLKKGFHQIEFWFADQVGFPASDPRGFEVRVLAPDAFDAVPITKDMMLLKKE